MRQSKKTKIVFYYTRGRTKRVIIPSDQYLVLKRKLTYEMYMHLSKLGLRIQRIYHKKYQDLESEIITSRNLSRHTLYYETIQT